MQYCAVIAEHGNGNLELGTWNPEPGIWILIFHISNFKSEFFRPIGRPDNVGTGTTGRADGFVINRAPPVISVHYSLLIIHWKAS